MSELDGIKIGDWLMIASTMKGSSFILQQVTSTTSGLVRTLNYTFRRDGRSFSLKQKSLTARLATAIEIEQWLSRHQSQQPKMGGNLLRSMQADPDVYTRSLRDAAVQAVAIDFQTIAAANNYWRK